MKDFSREEESGCTDLLYIHSKGLCILPFNGFFFNTATDTTSFLSWFRKPACATTGGGANSGAGGFDSLAQL